MKTGQSRSRLETDGRPIAIKLRARHTTKSARPQNTAHSDSQKQLNALSKNTDTAQWPPHGVMKLRPGEVLQDMQNRRDALGCSRAGRGGGQFREDSSHPASPRGRAPSAAAARAASSENRRRETTRSTINKHKTQPECRFRISGYRVPLQDTW